MALSKRKLFKYRREVAWYLHSHSELRSGMRVTYVSEDALSDRPISRIGEKNFLDQLKMMRSEGLIRVRSNYKGDEELNTLKNASVNVILKYGFENYLCDIEDEDTKHKETIKTIVIFSLIAVIIAAAVIVMINLPK